MKYVSGASKFPPQAMIIFGGFHCNNKEGMLVPQLFVNVPVFQKHLLSKLLVRRQSAVLNQRNLFAFAKNIVKEFSKSV